MNEKMTEALSSMSDYETARRILLAGFVGSILSLRFVDGMSRKQRGVAVISGMAMAHYLSPLIAFLFNEVDYTETVGFLIGLFGMSICAALFKAITKSDVWGLIEKKFGGNTP